MNDISDISSANDMISTTATNTKTDKNLEESRAIVDNVHNECIMESLNAYKKESLLILVIPGTS